MSDNDRAAVTRLLDEAADDIGMFRLFSANATAERHRWARKHDTLSEVDLALSNLESAASFLRDATHILRGA